MEFADRDLGIADGKRYVVSGSDEWRQKVQAEWDATLSRVTMGGAHVIVILPLWYERSAVNPPEIPGPNVNKVRDLYTQWAARHKDKVSVVDVAPIACPSGPPCPPVNGVDFRPDTVHYDDPGGLQVGRYLVTHVPELAKLAAGH